MKICIKCKIEKYDSLFGWESRKGQPRKYRRTVCKKCQAKYRKSHYQKNAEMAKVKGRSWARQHRDFIRQFLKGYLSEHPCVDCGISNIVVLEFDHVRGQKEFALSKAGSQHMSMERIKKEIDKCEVRCANCHRIKTVL